MTPTNDAVFVEMTELGEDGLRVGVKDCIDVAGSATRSGSAALADAAPALAHASVVRALLDGGCRIVGKTNMHELAYGVTGINGWTGTPVNTRYPDRVPGGSSSGSAVAVAAGSVDFAIGTDTGGSIRIPAACCGVYGLKPSFGRISRVGVHPAVSTLDCVGPFSRDINMLERAMMLMDASYVRRTEMPAVRIGWVNVNAEPQITASVMAHLHRTGVTLSRVNLPSFDAAYRAALTIIAAETWTAVGHLSASQALGADVRARLLAAREITSTAVNEAELVRSRFRDEVDAALEEVDVLALPTVFDVPPTLSTAGHPHVVLHLTGLVRQFNLSGHPALTLPLETPQGLPAGLQLVGPLHADATVCAVARYFARHEEFL
jgi:amidase